MRVFSDTRHTIDTPTLGTSYTWKLAVVKLPYLFVSEVAVCRLRGQCGSNVIVHFLIQCQGLFGTTDKVIG